MLLPNPNMKHFNTFPCQSSSVTQSYRTLCDPMDCSTSGFPVHDHLSEFGQTQVRGVSDAIQLLHPLLSPSPPSSILPSIRVFSSESVLHIRRLKYWSFNFSISPSNVYSGLISFRMDWLDLLAVQRTLKSLLQCNSSKASIIPYSAFLWHPTPVLLPGKSHGWRSLVVCSPWGC